MHHEVWPTIPPIHRVRKDDFAVDYTFQKLTNQKGALECKHEPYNYFGTYLPYLSKYAIIIPPCSIKRTFSCVFHLCDFRMLAKGFE